MRLRNLLLPCAVLVCAVSANAGVILSDTFSYADGILRGNGNWTDHSGLPDQMLVSGGKAVVHEDNSQSEDLHTAFTPVGGPAIYFGIDFSVDDLGSPYPAGTDNEYFAHFKDNGFNFNSRLDIVASTAGGDFSVGIGSDDSVADATWPVGLTYGVTYRVIVRYDQVINQAQLWIDATLSTDASILGDDRPNAPDINTQFALRQSSSDGGETIRVDNLIVSDDFASAVPEPASLLLLSLGAVALLRRR